MFPKKNQWGGGLLVFHTPPYNPPPRPFFQVRLSIGAPPGQKKHGSNVRLFLTDYGEFAVSFCLSLSFQAFYLGLMLFDLIEIT